MKTHQELNRLRSLLTPRDRLPNRSVTNLRLTDDSHRKCTITSSIPLTPEHDLHVDSCFNLGKSTATCLLEPPLPNSKLPSQILEDVFGMKEVTVSTATASTVPLTEIFVDEARPESSDNSASSPLDPIETLPVNERTMKHTLLYINPKAYTCFEHSETDLELQRLFTCTPPVSHTLHLQPRREQGSSVPRIDSFYGTKDLRRFGHASYFIPELSASERKVVGWRRSFRRGRRIYRSSLFRSTTDPCSVTFCEWVGGTQPGVESLSSCNSLDNQEIGRAHV